MHPSPRYRTRHLSRGLYLGRKMPPSSVGVAKLRKVGDGGVGGGSEGDRIRAAPTSLNLRPAFALPFSFSTLAQIRKCRNYSRGEQRINHDPSCLMSANSRNVDLFVSSSNGMSTYSERQRWICRYVEQCFTLTDFASKSEVYITHAQRLCENYANNQEAGFK